MIRDYQNITTDLPSLTNPEGLHDACIWCVDYRPQSKLQKQVPAEVSSQSQQAQEIATLKARVEQQDDWLGTYHEFKESISL